MWHSVKMSMAFSRSMSQSSNFEESCPSNVGISWSKDMLRFASLCSVQGINVCLHSSVHRFFIRLRGWMWWKCHSEVLKFISKLCELCHVCGWVGFRFQMGKLLLKLLELFS